MNMIDLRRITSPSVAGADEYLRRTLLSLAKSWDGADEMRHHRRLGSSDDLLAAQRYLARGNRGLIPTDRLFLANGTWNVLLILLETLVGRGNSIAVEGSTYSQVRDAANILGIRLVPVSLDADGLIPEAFDTACHVHRPKLLYCVPNAQNPTACTIPSGRRAQIAEIARRHEVVILEDDPQGLVREDFPPGFSDIAPDISWTVMGLSKCFFVGARIAYVVAPDRAAIEQVMSRFGAMAMWYASVPSAAMTTRAILEGAADDLLQAIRLEAGRRRELVVKLMPGISASCIGALHVWLKSDVLSGDELVDKARMEGVLVRSGSEFAVEKANSLDGIRVSLADVSPASLEEGLARLARIIGPDRCGDAMQAVKP
ncbi:PLP-dependent aminotransferase family protein [Bradyrhizobium elkanii]|uniref:aminotransferase-like domain-containing protein n=1 Tax=Bradyrhizobium elkanii TaxID=29448 RepID=UPI000685C1E5|nr:PLP-dependent aminotransferase family protein [Bradyrhizobium elkanii]WLA84859.1 PLP-dependent aminotransferase family protein [Bradyrhizobium elkanii]